MSSITSQIERPLGQDKCPCLRGKNFDECCGVEENSLPKDIYIQHKAIADKKCDDMVKYLSKQPRTDSEIVRSGSKVSKLGNVKDSSRVTFNVDPGKLSKKINHVVESALLDIVETKLNKTLLWYETPKVLLYVKGGWYARHTDSGYICPKSNQFLKRVDRDYSLLLYLSDKFEGGNITFNKFGYSYRPQKGDLLIFPSDNRFVHTAEKVTSGKRFAVVSFCAIKEEKKIHLTPPTDAIFIEKNRKPIARKGSLSTIISNLSD